MVTNNFFSKDCPNPHISAGLILLNSEITEFLRSQSRNENAMATFVDSVYRTNRNLHLHGKLGRSNTLFIKLFSWHYLLRSEYVHYSICM